MVSIGVLHTSDVGSNPTIPTNFMTNEECEQKCSVDKFWYVFCPNKIDDGGGIDGEWYKCSKCDRRWYLDYDEMR